MCAKSELFACYSAWSSFRSLFFTICATNSTLIRNRLMKCRRWLPASDLCLAKLTTMLRYSASQRSNSQTFNRLEKNLKCSNTFATVRKRGETCSWTCSHSEIYTRDKPPVSFSNPCSQTKWRASMTRTTVAPTQTQNKHKDLQVEPSHKNPT